MEKVRLAQEIILTTGNRVGLLADVSGVLSEKGINIVSISAYTIGKDANFHLIVSDYEQAREILSAQKDGYRLEDREVVVMTLENRAGGLAAVAKKFREEKIDLDYIYATTVEEGGLATVVFSSRDNARAVEIARYILSLSNWG